MNTFDLVIFDFDGTLADSANGIAACMRAAFESYDLLPPTLEDVRPRIGLSLEEAIRQLIRDRRDVDVATVAARYRELHSSVAAQATGLFPGARDALAMLDTAGIRLLVVSQKARRGLTQLLGQLEIDQYFGLVLGSDDVTAPKPQAALYDSHIAAWCGDVARNRVLVVGDTDIDLRFAMNIGAHGCWAEYGYGHPASCRALEPTYVISDITGVTSVCGLSPR
ncbi:MAG TPA: HAD hydrolase-like protein [Vicinamibacterales bacterium]|nr:HAD hydrolase-like protein [Vicinamibacterales bacterium]